MSFTFLAGITQNMVEYQKYQLLQKTTRNGFGEYHYEPRSTVILYLIRSERGGYIINKLFILTFVLVLAVANVAFAEQSDAEVVASFKQYVRGEVDRAIGTYEPDAYRVERYRILTSSGHGSTERIVWRKFYVTVDPQYTIELKKSDSLISPYIGTLRILKKYQVYEDSATKEEAQKSTTIRYNNTVTYEFTIAYQENQWVVTKLTNGGRNIKVKSIYDTLNRNAR